MLRTTFFCWIAICSLVWEAREVKAVAALTNGGFESPLGATFNAVLDDVPQTFDAWGAESGSVVGTENGVTPSAGANMLRLNSIGGVVSQIVQRVDVSSHAADIDAGMVQVSAEAFFNAPSSVPAAVAGVDIFFIDNGPFVDNFNITFNNSLAIAAVSAGIDNDPQTWEPLSIIDFPVPAGTRSFVVELLYNNASLGQGPGYADAAALSIKKVPEPSAFILATTVLLSLFGRRKRSI